MGINDEKRRLVADYEKLIAVYKNKVLTIEIGRPSEFEMNMSAIGYRAIRIGHDDKEFLAKFSSSKASKHLRGAIQKSFMEAMNKYLTRSKNPFRGSGNNIATE